MRSRRCIRGVAIALTAAAAMAIAACGPAVRPGSIAVSVLDQDNNRVTGELVLYRVAADGTATEFRRSSSGNGLVPITADEIVRDNAGRYKMVLTPPSGYEAVDDSDGATNDPSSPCAEPRACIYINVQANGVYSIGLPNASGTGTLSDDLGHTNLWYRVRRVASPLVEPAAAITTTTTTTPTATPTGQIPTGRDEGLPPPPPPKVGIYRPWPATPAVPGTNVPAKQETPPASEPDDGLPPPPLPRVHKGNSSRLPFSLNGVTIGSANCAGVAQTPDEGTPMELTGSMWVTDGVLHASTSLGAELAGTLTESGELHLTATDGAAPDSPLRIDGHLDQASQEFTGAWDVHVSDSCTVHVGVLIGFGPSPSELLI